MNTLRVKDLWSVNVRNTTAGPITLTLRGTVDESSEGRIVEGRTGQFVLQANESRVFNADNVPGGGKYTWNNRRFQEAIVRSGSSPSGSYTICIYAEDRSGRQLGQDCIQQTVMISQAPVLINPRQNEVLKTGTSPSFTWMQPAPSIQGTVYTLRMVEVIGEQSPIDAMARNPSLFEQNGLRMATLQYPPSARKLEVGKRYAWQVTVSSEGSRNQQSEISRSEVWTFTYEGEAKPERIMAPSVLPRAATEIVSPEAISQCAKRKLDVTCTSPDSGLYRITIINSLDSTSSEVDAREVRIHFRKGDTVLRFEPFELDDWITNPSKIPPATNELRLARRKGDVPSGTTVLGTAKMTVGSRAALVVHHEWLSSNGEILCSDSVTLSRSIQYYEAADEPMNVFADVPSDALYIQYVNPHASGDPVTIQIFDEEDQEVTYAGREPLSTGTNTNGVNRVRIPLKEYRLRANTSYTLLISMSTLTRYFHFTVADSRTNNDLSK